MSGRIKAGMQLIFLLHKLLWARISMGLLAQNLTASKTEQRSSCKRNTEDRPEGFPSGMTQITKLILLVSTHCCLCSCSLPFPVCSLLWKNSKQMLLSPWDMEVTFTIAEIGPPFLKKSHVTLFAIEVFWQFWNETKNGTTGGSDKLKQNFSVKTHHQRCQYKDLFDFNRAWSLGLI